MRRPVVFLDRDGTLIHDRPGFYLRRPESLRLYPCTARALKLLRSAGYRLVVLTNQSGLARGLLDERTLERIHRRLRSELRRRGASVDAFYHCPHSPADRCACRKPKTPLARRALRDLNLTLRGAAIIGDKLADVDLGRRLKITSVLVLTGHGRSQLKKYGKRLRPDRAARDLLAAARWLLNRRVRMTAIAGASKPPRAPAGTPRLRRA